MTDTKESTMTDTKESTVLRPDWHKAVQVQRGGKHISLPDDPDALPIPVAIDMLHKLYESEEQTVSHRLMLDAWPLDAAFAFNRAIMNRYGYSTITHTTGIFGRKNPPSKFAVDHPTAGTINIFYGSFDLPDLDDDGSVDMTVQRHDGRSVLFLVAEVKRKQEKVVLELYEEAKRLLREDSLYRGTAVEIEFDSDGDPRDPKFIRVANVTAETLIFSAATLLDVNTNIFTPIKHTEECRRRGVPLKRGVLLSGEFGTGKSLTATATANCCADHGWTFIMSRDPQHLHRTLEMAAKYLPAVVFVEDIDTLFEKGRTAATNDLLNTLDGIQSKQGDLMVIFTTNFPERLDPAILRPGRLDAVINVTKPDAGAVARLIKLYGGDQLVPDGDFEPVAKKLAGMGLIPAVVREIVERAKMYAIGENRGVISPDDLLGAGNLLEGHLALSKRNLEAQEERNAKPDGLGTQIANLVAAELERHGLARDERSTG